MNDETLIAKWSNENTSIYCDAYRPGSILYGKYKFIVHTINDEGDTDTAYVVADKELLCAMRNAIDSAIKELENPEPPQKEVI